MNESAQNSPPTASSSSAPENPPPIQPPVATVSLKLPPFWPNDPTVWFAQVEAQFHTRNITSQATKYAYIISSLQPEIAQEVRDLLLTPPANQPYDTLKSELLQRTSASEQKRLHQLLISEELGDRKPSQLLRRMRQLLGDNHLEDRILRQLFIQRLPMNTQLILASTADSVPLDQLASIADKILEVALPTPTVASLSPPATASLPSTSSPEIQNLQAQLNHLTSQLQTLTNQLQFQPRSRGRSQTRSPRRPSLSRSPARSTDPGGSFCWYHWNFGARAQKCNQPCSFPVSNPATAQSTQPPSHQENYQASD